MCILSDRQGAQATADTDTHEAECWVRRVSLVAIVTSQARNNQKPNVRPSRPVYAERADF